MAGDERTKTDKVPALITATSKLLNIRCQKLNAIAKINGLCLKHHGVPKAAINIMSKLYDSVSYTSITHLQDKYAEETVDILKSWTGPGITHVGDNVDIRSRRRHETADGSTYDLHFYNNVIFKPRLDYSSFADIPPQLPDEWNVSHLELLLPSTVDEEKLFQFLIPIVCDQWHHQYDCYKEYRNDGRHKYTPEMSQQSVMVCLKV